MDILTRSRLGCLLLLLLGMGSYLAIGRESSIPNVLQNTPNHAHLSAPGADTIKYRGYRLDLYGFKILKKTDDWIRISCSIVNSGRMDVNMGKEGTEHWVQMNFDQSLFDQKLGGFRENIRHALARTGFKLEAGKILRDFEVKFSTTPPFKPRTEPQVSLSESKELSKPSDSITAKGGDDEPFMEEELFLKRKEECPDIYFADLRILEQDDKWATLEYTITNQGKGIFYVFGERAGEEDNLAVRAYISGVPVLSRGALPVGGQLLQENGKNGDLLPGDSYIGQIKLDVRKKTRYLKSLILSLESYQFADECDKTNNTGAVVLE